jgi:ribosomal protein L34
MVLCNKIQWSSCTGLVDIRRALKTHSIIDDVRKLGMLAYDLLDIMSTKEYAENHGFQDQMANRVGQKVFNRKRFKVDIVQRSCRFNQETAQYLVAMSQCTSMQEDVLTPF